MPDIKYIEELRYEFSSAEVAEIAQQLASENLRIAAWEEEKSLTSSHLNSLIKGASAKAYELAKKVQNGFEMRQVECTVVFNEPVEGMKRIVDVATGQVVREVPMTREEQMQRSLDFEGGRS